MQNIVKHLISIEIRLQGGQIHMCSANVGAKFQDELIDGGTSGMSMIG